MRMRILYMILSAIGIFGALASLVQFVMALCHLEFGRVVYYFITTVLLTELAVLAILKLRKTKK